MTDEQPQGVPFFVVWREHGSSPTVKHMSLKSAQEEAERLARRTPGPCWVLAATDRFEMTTLETASFPFDRAFEDAKPNDDLPF